MSHPRIVRLLLPIIVLLVTLLACAGGSTVGGATPTVSFSTATPGGSISISLLTPTITVEGAINQNTLLIGPVATATAQAAANFASTATAQALIPTATVPGIFAAPAVCPQSGTATLPSEPPSFPRYAGVINDFLSNGGATTILEVTLRTWGALTEFGGLVRADRDFTADGVPDVLVLAFDPQHIEDFPQPGDLFIFGCAEGSYRLLYQAGYSVDRGAPILHSADDINGDRINDLVYSVKTCGETTCEDEVSILEWSLDVENFASLLSQKIIEPNADIVVSDVDEDSLLEVSVTNGLIPTTDAGPQRQSTTIYKWDGVQYSLSQVIKPVAEYRIHVIYDAEDALLLGNYSEAISTYRTAINDDDLLNWVYPNEDQYLRAYARFHLMLTYIRAGNIGAAQTAHDDLMAIYAPPPLPPCDPAADPNCPPTPTPFFGPMAGLEFARMADLFWSDFSVNRNLGQSCGLVVAYTRANPTSLEALNSFGFANRQVTATDMCPFGG